MQRIGPSRAIARPVSGTRLFSSRASRGQHWIHPRFRGLPPPVIVIGMHRSGTSLVAGMLGALGVYVGPECGGASGPDFLAMARAGRLTGYAEASAFFRINEQLLRLSRSSWCRVDPFLRRRTHPAWAQAADLSLRSQTYSSLLRDFLQPLPEHYRGAWGWKDPRNSVTLPLWLRLFPEARVVHVTRDSDAVVRSLHHRARQWQSESVHQDSRMKLYPVDALKTTARKLGLLAPLRPDPCLDPSYCRELCRVYEQECALAPEAGVAYLRVRYEEILDDPKEAAFRLAHFTGCSVEAQNIREAGTLVLRER